MQEAKNALKGISDIQQRRLLFGSAIVKKIKELNNEDIVKSNPLYASIKIKKGERKELESLQRLQRLERLQRLNCSYDEVEIKKDSIVYCDIPYKNTDGYGMDFDYEKFYKWATAQTELVFISEYNMPEE